jgi:exopolysaccharide biosynthesis WecB/TagA/CpsF family protein
MSRITVTPNLGGGHIAAGTVASGQIQARQISLAGIVTDLLEQDQAVEVIIDAARSQLDEVLGVVSANLDHVHHFARNQQLQVSREAGTPGTVRWLNLLDGAPLVWRARQLTGRQWPRLAGSDLIEPILDAAEFNSLSIGFLGGSAATHADLATVMSRRWPNLHVAGYWAPERADLTDARASQALTNQIAQAQLRLLVVCLGKPRQEEWIADHGHASGAKVCLGFGAVADFLAGRVPRAPRWMANHGLEWAWRLLREPRRLARRYLIQGPPAYWSLQRNSYLVPELPD